VSHNASTKVAVGVKTKLLRETEFTEGGAVWTHISTQSQQTKLLTSFVTVRLKIDDVLCLDLQSHFDSTVLVMLFSLKSR
jgi:hypothetical protein